MYHFFVTPETIYTAEIHITGQDVNHIKNVLRMKVGDELLVSDGQGNDYHCCISSFSEEGAPKVVCRIMEKSGSGTEPAAQLYLFQGLPKADKFETVIQKSVELGVYEVIPVFTERTIVKYDAGKQKSKQQRWQKIAEGAAKQSHRGIIPDVKAPLAWADALSYAASIGLDLFFVPYENYKDMKATKEKIASVRPGMKVGILIGPEGGFAEREVEEAISSGAQPISLGNRILRTETAPLMLLSVLMFTLE